MTRNWWWGGAALLGVLAVLYQPALVSLAQQWWDDENYSHGFLIPVISGYLVWERWGRLRRAERAPSAWGLAALVTGVALYLLGRVAAELFTTRVSLLVTLAGLVVYLLGWSVLRTLAFPLAYLLFMIPPPAIVFNAIAFPLQLFAARAAASGLQLLGIPVLREGNLIVLANTSLEVAEACSGLRSLVTLLALAATFAYFTQKTAWRRWALLATAVPIAIIANAARVAGTGILAHHFGDQVAQGFFHTFSGWLVFVTAALLLVATGALLGAVGGRFTVRHVAPGV